MSSTCCLISGEQLTSLFRFGVPGNFSWNQRHFDNAICVSTCPKLSQVVKYLRELKLWMNGSADKASMIPSTSLALLGHPMHTRSRRHHGAEVSDHAGPQELHDLHLVHSKPEHSCPIFGTECTRGPMTYDQASRGES